MKYANFFPVPEKNCVITPCQSGSARVFAGDMALQISWMEIYLILLPFWNISHDFSAQILLKKRSSQDNNIRVIGSDQDMCILVMLYLLCSTYTTLVSKLHGERINSLIESCTRISVNGCIKCCKENFPHQRQTGQSLQCSRAMSHLLTLANLLACN